MDYSQPQRADRLAAEYVLGTLHGPARRRFEALLPAHAGLRRAVASWRSVLIPLAASVRPVTPDPDVWTGVQERLFGPKSAAVASGPSDYPPYWWERASTWQIFSLFCLVGILLLSLALWWPRAPRPPVLVMLAPGSGPASFVATVGSDGRSLVLAPIGGLTVDPGSSLELWTISPQGVPHSLGIVSSSKPTTIVRPHLLDNVGTLALSIEASGGSHSGRPAKPLASTGKLPPSL